MFVDCTIRKGSFHNLPELKTLFVDTITAVCKNDYTPEQIEAWVWNTKNHSNNERWENIITNQLVFVVEINHTIVGFVTLDGGNYIDMLYVHKDYQRQGIAKKLYETIEQEAMKLQQTFLTSDVSKTAKAFFEHQKFETIAEQTVVVRGIELINYKMKKNLTL